MTREETAAAFWAQEEDRKRALETAMYAVVHAADDLFASRQGGPRWREVQAEKDLEAAVMAWRAVR